MNKFVGNITEEMCVIDNKVFKLEDIEKMGINEFSTSVHIHPLKGLFKYFSNTKVYVKSEKKYRNYSFEALKNNTVFLQDAVNFDDCFDCAVDLDYNDFFYNRLLKYCEYFDIEINNHQDINSLVILLAKKLYDYRNIDKALKNIKHFDNEIINLRLKIFVTGVFSNVYKKQDWNEAISLVIKNEYDEFRNVLSEFKISCFSTSPYLNRMWSSSYANNNKGFCIEYEIDLNNQESIDMYANIFPVIYSQKRNDFIPLSLNIDEFPSEDDLWQMYYNGLLRKSIHWMDQMEWRLIMHKNSITDNPMYFFKIKKIYLGNKMPKNERLKIIRYCKKHYIEYVGLIRKSNSFDLVECYNDCFICYNNNFDKNNM